MTTLWGGATSRTLRPHWMLHDVVETEIGAEAVAVEGLPEAPWFGNIDPALLSHRALVDPNRLSIGDLYTRIRYLEREGLDASAYNLALWNKGLQPAAMFGLVLLAFSFAIGPLREAGLGARISAGVGVGPCFQYLPDLFAPLSQVYGLDAPLAVALPIAACWLAGFWGLRRAA